MKPTYPLHAAAGFRAHGRVALFAIVGAVLSLGLAGSARADDGSSPMSLTGVGVSAAAPFGTVGEHSSWDLVNSGFTLDQVDPLSGAVVGDNVSDALSADYLTSVDLMNTQQMAFDAGGLARRAQAEAEARRLAALRSGNGKLKPGTVPSPYDQILQNAIGSCPGLPIGVVAAQLEQESNWNPKAVSNAKPPAQGIAQFQAPTWATEGVDGNGDGKKDVWNPEDAIPAAVAFDCKLLAEAKQIKSNEDPIRLMLAGYNAGMQAVRDHNGIPLGGETEQYVRKIMDAAANFADPDDSGQTEVGPDGCPSQVPSNTLREGAASMGAAKLCADSVAQARTPAAAQAIKYVFAHLGAPYSQPKRNQKGWYDCSSYLSRAYQAAGIPIAPAGQNAPVTDTLAAGQHGHTHQVSYASRKPGDLIFPHAGHVGMVLADGYMIHTNRTGDVSHVKRLYSSAWLVMRVD